MSIPHQSLKELAQRPDEEVVQLWLEQRGFHMLTAKPAHIPVPNSGQQLKEEVTLGGAPFVVQPPTAQSSWKFSVAQPNHAAELEHRAGLVTLEKFDLLLEELPKLQVQINDLKRVAIMQIQSQESHWQEERLIKEELLKINNRLEQIESHLSQLVPERTKNTLG